MPQFISPFVGMVPDRKMTRAELVRAIRQNVAAEHEATHLYTAIADATDNQVAQKVLREVANDERVHIGNFTRLIEMLDGTEGIYLEKGSQETDKDTEELREQEDAVPRWVSPMFNPKDPFGVVRDFITSLSPNR